MSVNNVLSCNECEQCPEQWAWTARNLKCKQSRLLPASCFWPGQPRPQRWLSSLEGQNHFGCPWTCASILSIVNAMDDDEDDESDPYGWRWWKVWQPIWIIMKMMKSVVTHMQGQVQEAEVASHLCKSQSQSVQDQAPDHVCDHMMIGLQSFFFSPESLHLASQSGSRRKACQRRSSLGRLAGTLWPDLNNYQHQEQWGLKRGGGEDDLDPHGDILAWPSLHPLIAITSKGSLQHFRFFCISSISNYAQVHFLTSPRWLEFRLVMKKVETLVTLTIPSRVVRK